MTEEGLERLQEIMTRAGELDKKTTVDILCDNSIAKEVYKKIYG